MSQSAALYRIAASDFELIVKDPQQANLVALSKAHCTIPGIHEGFRFLLSIGRDAATIDLIDQVFYPTESVDGSPGKEPEGDWEDGIQETIFPYNNPVTVASIAAFLTGIDDTTITGLYNTNELNENDVYPSAWNNDASGKYAYNLHHLLREWPRLKNLYVHAAAEGDYVFCLVG